MVSIRTEDVSYKQRCYVQALRNNAGWTFQRIARDQGLALSTVYGICSGPATPQRVGKCGRKVKIDTPTRRRLVFAATSTAENRRKPYSEVANEMGIEASDKTLRTAFAKEGYHRRIARKKPFLDQIKRDKRLRFALQHRHWTREDWRKVIWTDECYIWLGGSCRKIYVTRAVEEEWHDDCIAPKFAKKDSIMIWGGILGSGGRKTIRIWEREDWGTITAHTYCNHILVPLIHPFWFWESHANGQWLWLMEDRAPAHTAILTRVSSQYIHMLSSISFSAFFSFSWTDMTRIIATP